MESLNYTKELAEVGITTRPRMNTLKYGLQSPLHDYYHFNCYRQNDVRTVLKNR